MSGPAGLSLATEPAQAENRRLGFVEVLSECPLHLDKTPQQAERWVREEMTKVFPLGVKKDETVEPWNDWRRPSFDPETVAAALGAGEERAPRFCRGFPRRPFGSDVAFKLAGAGGDGAQTAAMLIARAAINEGFDATHIPSYGPESRGGTSYADVRVAESEVLSPAVHHPRVRLVGVPCTAIAQELGFVGAKNVVALGALCAATSLFPAQTYLTALRQALRHKRELLALDERALAAGVRAARE